MTHNNIYTKFMIEYDKANITSSYPSLTKFEIATILDRAYLGLIARKVTGNNPRRSIFESDVKSVEDLRPLVVSNFFDVANDSDTVLADNEYLYKLPEDLLYYLRGQVQVRRSGSSLDSKSHTNQNVLFTDHETAQLFRATESNMPWIKTPVSFIEDSELHLLIDPYKQYKESASLQFVGTYIKKPQPFVKDNLFDDTQFELSDTMVEELINLAVLFALENVESTRLQSKSSTLPLES